MLNFIKTRPEQILQIYCPKCDNKLNECDRCGEDIDPDEVMYCNKLTDNYHICKSCKDDLE